ncbi:MAG TPA: ABC transporter ATP-binding protein [Dongiaceae bacterium]|jgi:glycerol transport system ATP-binding protein|nr:ABC transporter ATP-binding protein [Dongiaceae bacterium]
MARIDLVDLSHSYVADPRRREDYALSKLNMTWQDGGAYALLGPSGCGKTTLLNIISGLLKPTTGRVLFNGQDVTLLNPQQRNIAQVFQFPVIYDTMTVADNLAFPLRNRGWGAAETRKRVEEIAEILELTGDLKHRASGLSADAKQKISMGRGLVRPDVAAVLFDEPLTTIDQHLKWTLRRKLKQIHAQLKLSLIYVTHDQVEAMTFADQVVVMYGGEVVQMGSPQDLFEQPAHTFVGFFVGSPGMNLMPCTIEGGSAVVADTRIPLDPAAAQVAGRAGGKLTLGIRPEFVELAAPGTPDTVLGAVERVEDLGNYKIVSARLGQQLIMAKIGEDETIASDTVHLRFPPRWTRLYADDRALTGTGG